VKRDAQIWNQLRFLYIAGMNSWRNDLKLKRMIISYPLLANSRIQMPTVASELTFGSRSYCLLKNLSPTRWWLTPRSRNLLSKKWVYNYKYRCQITDVELNITTSPKITASINYTPKDTRISHYRVPQVLAFCQILKITRWWQWSRSCGDLRSW